MTLIKKIILGRVKNIIKSIIAFRIEIAHEINYSRQIHCYKIIIQVWNEQIERIPNNNSKKKIIQLTEGGDL